MVGSCQQLLQEAEERLGTELVGSPAPQGLKQLVLTWPQLRKLLLLSQHLSGEGMLRPCPPLFSGRHSAGSAGRAFRGLIFYRWGT